LGAVADPPQKKAAMATFGQRMPEGFLVPIHNCGPVYEVTGVNPQAYLCDVLARMFARHPMSRASLHQRKAAFPRFPGGVR
jgi:hypothetical protein